MVSRVVLRWSFCLLLLSIAACSTQDAELNRSGAAVASQKGQAAGVEDEVLISIDGAELTEQQVRWLSRTPPGQELRDSERRRTANMWLRNHVVYKEALRRGIDKNAKTQFLVDFVTQRVCANQLTDIVRKEAEVPEEKILEYYNEKKDKDRRLTEPLRLDFSHVRTQERDEAQAALTRINNGEDINAVAKDISMDRYARKGGKVEGMAELRVKSLYGDRLFNALVKASQGDIVGPIKYKDGFYGVVRFEGKTAPKLKPLKEVEEYVRSKVKGIVSGQAVYEFVESLKKDAEPRVVKSPRIEIEKKTGGRSAEKKSEPKVSVKVRPIEPKSKE